MSGFTKVLVGICVLVVLATLAAVLPASWFGTGNVFRHMLDEGFRHLGGGIISFPMLVPVMLGMLIYSILSDCGHPPRLWFGNGEKMVVVILRWVGIVAVITFVTIGIYMLHDSSMAR